MGGRWRGRARGARISLNEMFKCIEGIPNFPTDVLKSIKGGPVFHTGGLKSIGAAGFPIPVISNKYQTTLNILKTN